MEDFRNPQKLRQDAAWKGCHSALKTQIRVHGIVLDTE
jgi:hypothetical protein